MTLEVLVITRLQPLTMATEADQRKPLAGESHISHSNTVGALRAKAQMHAAVAQPLVILELIDALWSLRS